MNDIFLSYKREDEGRVALLVRALEGAGLSVWWDRALPGGEDWRARIEAALDAAKIVIVCWSRASVGPEGGFVRDEAARAGDRLLPVLLERGVRAPIGFGQIQAFDLSHWRGKESDPFLGDLVAAIQARLKGAAPPKPQGPAARAFRRFVYGGGLTALLLAALGFTLSTPVVRENACAIPVPGLARTCCLAGFTEKSLVRDGHWMPAADRQFAMYLGRGEAPFPSREAAIADAQNRLDADAQRNCTPPDPASQRVSEAKARSPAFQCQQFSTGWQCAADYTVTCKMEERPLIARCPG